MTLTKEQREDKAAAYAAFLEDRNIKLEGAWSDSQIWRSDNAIHKDAWLNDEFLIRLAQPAPTSIPWHNPEGVTEEQLKRDKGWRFLTADEVGMTSITAHPWNTSMVAWEDEYYPFNNRRTFRTKAPLPTKYAHLEEAKEFAARSAFAAYKLNEWERLEWRGKAWSSETRSFLYCADNDNTAYRGETHPCGCKRTYYAEIIPEETAEDVARRLLKDVPQKEGYGPWEFEARGPVSRASSNEELIHFARDWHTHLYTAGDGNNFYARARKLESELVPYTMETWPLHDVWVVAPGSRYKRRVLAVEPAGIHLNDGFNTFAKIFAGHMMSEDFGKTWRKCGQEAK